MQEKENHTHGCLIKSLNQKVKNINFDQKPKNV